MGQAGSAKWIEMLDAAEAILREDGAQALTSRRIAERLDTQQRLVYYYFATMDDLITATFRRLSERELERLGEAVRADHPMEKAWQVCIHTLDPRLISEFMALANRIDELRTEVKGFIEGSRRLQVELLSSALARNPGLSRLSPNALAILGTSVALDLPRERELGIDLGHEGVVALISKFMAEADA